jgi:hypothetical protein
MRGRGPEQMPRCSHTYADSSQCKRIVSAEQSYCYSHDPDRSEERKRNAARGGKAKASGEIGRVKANLQALADATLEGEVDKGVAAVTSQIWNTYLAAVRTELKVREVTELEERLEEVEEILERRRKDARWRA